MLVSDDVNTMITELASLAGNIAQLKFSGTYNRQKLVKGKHGASYLENYKINEKGMLYSKPQSILLAQKVKELSANIQSMLNSAPADSALHAEARAILLQTYSIIMNPTKANRAELKTLANQVSGNGSVWAQIGMVLLAIVGIICVFPAGVFYIEGINKKNGAWDRHKRSGLAKEVDKIDEGIRKTGVYSRVSKGSFFKDEVAVTPATEPVESENLISFS
jgi:hypothetical protein